MQTTCVAENSTPALNYWHFVLLREINLGSFLKDNILCWGMRDKVVCQSKGYTLYYCYWKWRLLVACQPYNAVTVRALSASSRIRRAGVLDISSLEININSFLSSSWHMWTECRYSGDYHCITHVKPAGFRWRMAIAHSMVKLPGFILRLTEWCRCDEDECDKTISVRGSIFER